MLKGGLVVIFPYLLTLLLNTDKSSNAEGTRGCNTECIDTLALAVLLMTHQGTSTLLSENSTGIISAVAGDGTLRYRSRTSGMKSAKVPWQCRNRRIRGHLQI